MGDVHSLQYCPSCHPEALYRDASSIHIPYDHGVRAGEREIEEGEIEEREREIEERERERERER
jgi:DnaJ-class molecular chaperone